MRKSTVRRDSRTVRSCLATAQLGGATASSNVARVVWRHQPLPGAWWFSTKVSSQSRQTCKTQLEWVSDSPAAIVTVASKLTKPIDAIWSLQASKRSYPVPDICIDISRLILG